MGALLETVLERRLLARPHFCRAVDRRTYALSAQPQRGLPPLTQLLRGLLRRGGCCRPHKRTVRLLATVNRLQAVHQVQ